MHWHRTDFQSKSAAEFSTTPAVFREPLRTRSLGALPAEPDLTPPSSATAIPALRPGESHRSSPSRTRGAVSARGHRETNVTARPYFVANPSIATYYSPLGRTEASTGTGRKHSWHGSIGLIFCTVNCQSQRESAGRAPKPRSKSRKEWRLSVSSWTGEVSTTLNRRQWSNVMAADDDVGRTLLPTHLARAGCDKRAASGHG